MGIILSNINLKNPSTLKKDNQELVVVGGCFDILHTGHIEFLKKAKEAGDLLVVLVESDERIKKIKGEGRPVNSQQDRTKILSNLSFVDFVIALKDMNLDKDYEILVKWLKPDIIAVTAGNTIFDWEKDLANRTGVKIIEVTKRIKDYSTSKIVQGTRL